jgi:hypothetical protein
MSSPSIGANRYRRQDDPRILAGKRILDEEPIPASGFSSMGQVGNRLEGNVGTHDYTVLHGLVLFAYQADVAVMRRAQNCCDWTAV